MEERLEDPEGEPKFLGTNQGVRGMAGLEGWEGRGAVGAEVRGREVDLVEDSREM